MDFSWHEAARQMGGFLGANMGALIFLLIKIAVIILLVLLAVVIVRFIFNPRRLQRHRHGADTTGTIFLRRFFTALVYVLGVAYILALIPAFRTIGTSILTSAGILAAAVGLASQEALSNLVSGIFIIFAKPFRIGDWVTIEGTDLQGTVEEITLRHTIIRTTNNNRVIVPNSKANSSIIINNTIDNSENCAFIEVGVGYKENLDNVIKEMRTVIEQSPLLIDHRTEKEKTEGAEKVIIRVTELGASAVKLRAYAWTKNYSDAFVLKCDMNKAIKDHFDKVGIEIPYPYYNVVQRNN